MAAAPGRPASAWTARTAVASRDRAACKAERLGSGLAALKIQVRWNLKTGELPQVLIEVGKASDAKSPIAQQAALAGSLEIFDLGYFSLERFCRLAEKKAFFISRLQHGTTVLSEQGEVLNLREFLPGDFLFVTHLGHTLQLVYNYD